MGILSYIATTLLYYIIDVSILLMFIRAILSWFGPGAGGRFGMFVYNVTEIIISPIRSLLSRFESLRTLPIDISFTVTWLLLVIIQIVLF